MMFCRIIVLVIHGVEILFFSHSGVNMCCIPDGRDDMLG